MYSRLEIILAILDETVLNDEQKVLLRDGMEGPPVSRLLMRQREQAAALSERIAAAEARATEASLRADDLNAELARVNDQNAELVKALSGNAKK